MTHKITSVLLQKICLQTLVLDLLIWLYYPEQILPFSQVNIYHSVEWKKKNLVALSILIPRLPHLHEKAELSLRMHSSLY